jgi:hypothetical protein
MRCTPPRLSVAILTHGTIAAALATTPVAAENETAAAWQHFRARSAATLNALAQTTVAAAADDATPVADLSFEHFFVAVGDEGLAFTDYLAALAGKRVRVTGFMVRDPRRQNGVFLLAQRPGSVQAEGRCAAPDLPPAIVYVHPPENSGSALMPYVPGRLTVTGTLQLGAQPEANGLNSWVRVKLDRVPPFIKANDSPLATAGQP